MRSPGRILLTLMMLAAACPATAAPTASDAGRLDRAIFNVKAAKPAVPSRSSARGMGPALTDGSPLTLAGGPADTERLAGDAVDSHPRLGPGLIMASGGFPEFRNTAVQPPHRLAADSVRPKAGALFGEPRGQPLPGADDGFEPEAQAFDLHLTRGWPAALAVTAGGVDMDVTPHAGLGLGSGVATAEAGAVVRLGAHLRDTLIGGLSGLGLRRMNPAGANAPGRFYLYASASGRAVDVSLSREAPGDPQRMGWGLDGAGEMISDAGAGMAWRKGAVQASFGYVHREIRNDAAMAGRIDPGKLTDSMVAFSFTIRAR